MGAALSGFNLEGWWYADEAKLKGYPVAADLNGALGRVLQRQEMGVRWLGKRRLEVA
jgi:hypothetical protein